MPDFTPQDLEHFVGILEDPAASDEIRELAEHLVSMYFSLPSETRARDTGEELLRIRSRTDFDAFCEYVFGLPPYGHLKFITKVLKDERRKRTLIVIPPGHGKTSVVSLMWPPFWVGGHLERCMQMVGSSADMVEKPGSQIRPLLAGEGAAGERYKKVFPEVTPDIPAGWTQQKLYCQREYPNKDPNLYLVGVTSGALLGSRSSFTLIDDVVSPSAARSPTEMAKITKDFHDVIMTRLESDARVVCIMTRFGESDLAPVLVNDLDFEVLHAPALEDKDPRGAWIDFIPSRSYLRDPLPGAKEKTAQWIKHPNPDAWVQQQLEQAQREAREDGFETEITTSKAHGNRPALRTFIHPDGDPVLWPELFSKEALQQKRDQNPVSFRLVYGGDPTGIEGTTFKRSWFRYYGRDQTISQLPRSTRTFQTVDPSVGKSQTKGDYFVICTVAVDEYGNKFVTDVYHDRVATPLQPDLVTDYYRKHPQTELILVDSVAYQYALFAELEKRGLPVEPVDSKKNKVTKLDASAVFYKQGRVFLDIDAPWVDDFISEFTSYPTGKHDDQIDAMSNLLEWLSFNFDLGNEELEVGFG